MGEALITRRGGAGGGFDLETYDAELSAKETSKMRILVDTNGWDYGLYRGLFAYFSGNNFYTFCPYIMVTYAWNQRTVEFNSSNCMATMVYTNDSANYPNYNNGASGSTNTQISNYSPSTGVYRLDYTFNNTVNNGTIEVLCAKFFKIAL